MHLAGMHAGGGQKANNSGLIVVHSSFTNVLSLLLLFPQNEVRPRSIDTFLYTLISEQVRLD